MKSARDLSQLEETIPVFKWLSRMRRLNAALLHDTFVGLEEGGMETILPIVKYKNIARIRCSFRQITSTSG